MIEASGISFLNESLYYYRSNPTSILNSSANAFDIFEEIDLVEEFLNKNGYYKDLENEFIFFKIAQILLYRISKQPPEYFYRAREEFSKITINDEGSLKKYALNRYRRVLSSKSYDDYISNYRNRNNQSTLSKLFGFLKKHQK